MKVSFISSFSAALVLGVALAAAALPARAGDTGAVEIQHLLEFVRDSGCTFIRNGNDYTSAEAAEHIAMKARNAGSRVKDGETLIEFAGSKSSLSGKPYFVQCPGSPKIESATWMRTELTRFRATQATALVKP